MANQGIIGMAERRLRQPFGLTIYQMLLLLAMLVIAPSGLIKLYLQLSTQSSDSNLLAVIDLPQAIAFGIIFLVCAILTVEVSEYNFVTSAHLVALAVVYTPLGQATAIGLTLVMLLPTYFALTMVVRTGVRTFITPLASKSALPHLASIFAMASISFLVAGVTFDLIGGNRPLELDQNGRQLLLLGVSYLIFQIIWRLLLGTYIGLLRGGFSLRPFMPAALLDGLVDPFVLLSMLLLYERYRIAGILLLLVPLFGISRLLSDLMTAKRSLQHVLAQVTSAHEEERKRISRELHDGTAQSIASQLALVDVTQRMLSADPPEVDSARSLLRELRNQANDTLTDVRRFSRNLRPSLLDDLGLIPALRWYTNDFAKTAPFNVKLMIQDRTDPVGRWISDSENEVDISTKRLPAPVELAAFRLVQEALTNAKKHANPHNVEVTLRLGVDSVEVIVHDDGRGLAPALLHEESRARVSRLAARGHLGLMSMLERAEQLGGSLELVSRPGQGTTVRAWLPLS